MTTIAEAKARLQAEENKVLAALNTLIGTRPVLAVLTLLVVGFGSHCVFFPDRLPDVRGLNFAEVGLPSVDFGKAGELAQQAQHSAANSNAEAKVAGFVSSNGLTPLLNGLGLLVSLLLLIWNILAAARRWRDPAWRALPGK